MRQRHDCQPEGSPGNLGSDLSQSSSSSETKFERLLTPCGQSGLVGNLYIKDNGTTPAPASQVLKIKGINGTFSSETLEVSFLFCSLTSVLSSVYPRLASHSLF